jgi:glycosyltransferase involved in cell wall biosynthesis
MATGAIVWQITRNRMTGTYDNLVDRYICLTEFAKSRYVAAGFPEHNIIVKPNFLPENRFSLSPSSQPYAVFVGRLTDEKGIRTLLSAWQHVADLPLKIIGDGALMQELQAFATERKLPVEFLGFRSNLEVLDIVGNATLQVIPSECYEGFPMVILEAYGLGVPVVASRIGSLQEIVEDGVTGVKFKPADALDLAEKVNSLKGDVGLLSKMKQNAKALYQQKYTAEQNFKQLMAIYQQVIAEFTGA